MQTPSSREIKPAERLRGYQHQREVYSLIQNLKTRLKKLSNSKNANNIKSNHMIPNSISEVTTNRKNFSVSPRAQFASSEPNAPFVVLGCIQQVIQKSKRQIIKNVKVRKLAAAQKENSQRVEKSLRRSL